MNQQLITFAFQKGVPRNRQCEILDEINTWDDVDHAGQLKPESDHEMLLRLCYAYLCEEADPLSVAERLSEIPEIESASQPASRHLVNQPKIETTEKKETKSGLKRMAHKPQRGRG